MNVDKAMQIIGGDDGIGIGVGQLVFGDPFTSTAISVVAASTIDRTPRRKAGFLVPRPSSDMPRRVMILAIGPAGKDGALVPIEIPSAPTGANESPPPTISARPKARSPSPS